MKYAIPRQNNIHDPTEELKYTELENEKVVSADGGKEGKKMGRYRSKDIK
jgi:hypothetical protein